MPDMLLLGQQLLEEFLTAIKDEMIDYLDTADRNATGRTRASIKIENLTQTSGQLVGADWIEYTFGGRGPGAMPPINAIVDWCNARGIPRSRAWAIAKTIAEAGTVLYRQLKAIGKPSMLDFIITEKKIEQFKEDLTAIYTAQIQTVLDEILEPAQ